MPGFNAKSYGLVYIIVYNAIVYIKETAYRIHFWYMSKDDAISIMNGSNLVGKRGVL